MAVAAAHPAAYRFGCSTAGDIFGTQVADDSLVITAVRFERTRVLGRSTRISGPEDSLAAGERLAQSLEHEGLVHVFVLSDGLHVNGSQLVEGLARNLPREVTVTGGLSGDGARFRETLVIGGGLLSHRRSPRSAFTGRACGSATPRSAAGTHSARSA